MPGAVLLAPRLATPHCAFRGRWLLALIPLAEELGIELSLTRARQGSTTTPATCRLRRRRPLAACTGTRAGGGRDGGPRARPRLLAASTPTPPSSSVSSSHPSASAGPGSVSTDAAQPSLNGASTTRLAHGGHVWRERKERGGEPRRTGRQVVNGECLSGVEMDPFHSHSHSPTATTARPQRRHPPCDLLPRLVLFYRHLPLHLRASQRRRQRAPLPGAFPDATVPVDLRTLQRRALHPPPSPPAPPPSAHPSVSVSLLATLRLLMTALDSALTAGSEHAQVTRGCGRIMHDSSPRPRLGARITHCHFGVRAATADAGRKIRTLGNRLEGVRRRSGVGRVDPPGSARSARYGFSWGLTRGVRCGVTEHLRAFEGSPEEATRGGPRRFMAA
ncbi:hypothetical protein DFH09DRAFT_1306157 [Mycena vulgaris]|nr:hypothetical protein DFH09DRAFT_1306157 [Mycena vulgaris]